MSTSAIAHTRLCQAIRLFRISCNLSYLALRSAYTFSTSCFCAKRSCTICSRPPARFVTSSYSLLRSKSSATFSSRLCTRCACRSRKACWDFRFCSLLLYRLLNTHLTGQERHCILSAFLIMRKSNQRTWFLIALLLASLSPRVVGAYRF